MALGGIRAILRTLTERISADPGPLTVVLAGGAWSTLGFSEATATEILRAHDDLSAALLAVTERGGQVVYVIGNHDGDLAWGRRGVRRGAGADGARLCLEADLVLDGGRRVLVEHGHQLDPYNCFHDPRNSLDKPLGHHIVREVIPRLSELLGKGWIDGARGISRSDGLSRTSSRRGWRTGSWSGTCGRYSRSE